jgi:transposase
MEDVVCVVGVDWGDQSHAWAERTLDGREAEGKIPSEPDAVHEWVRQLRGRHPEGKIAIALEQSRGALIYALEQYDFLVLMPLNPRGTKRYRQALILSGAKDDPVDARLHRDFAWRHRATLRVWQPQDANCRKLRLLVEARRKMVGHRTAAIQALTAALKEYFPQVLSWFDDGTGKLARAFLLRWPTLAQACTARADAITKVVKAHSRQKPEAIEELIASIRSAVALTDDAAIIEAMSLLAVSYVSIIETLEESISKYDHEIESLWATNADHDIFANVPGAGPALAPRLAVAFGGQRDRYESAAEMQNYSGIAPVLERSGKRCIVRARWHCPKFLRQTFHEHAAASITKSAWALAFYRHKRDGGVGHHAALRALAFRWIRILYACWKNRVQYDEQKHIAELKRRNSPIIARLAA